MKVTHIYHSSFYIELEHHTLLFDYYQGELNINKDKPLYIFISHNHYDHYNEAIFNIDHPNKTYILGFLNNHEKSYTVVPHQHYVFDDIKVQTLLSTDEGVAFVITVENQTLYFSGDLNWWKWDEESAENNLYQEKTYKQEIDSIHQKIDLALLVVDSRQEDDYLLGLTYFLKKVTVRNIIPMHYFGDYKISAKLKQELLIQASPVRFYLPSYQNQTFDIQ